MVGSSGNFTVSGNVRVVAVVPDVNWNPNIRFSKEASEATEPSVIANDVTVPKSVKVFGWIVAEVTPDFAEYDEASALLGMASSNSCTCAPVKVEL